MKSHWFTSPDPPKFGEDLIALCGKLVPKAQPVPAIWSDEDGDYGLVKCHACDLHGFGPGRPGRYVAVIQSGEESIERG